MTLPLGFAVKLNRHVRVRDGGRTLVGGSPTRLIRLSSAAAERLHHGIVHVRDRASAVLADRLLDGGLADPVVSELSDLDPGQVTVVIPVHDRPAMLDRLLSSLGGRHRVIVVADAPPDPRAVAAVATAHGAELVTLAQNAGPASARNAGLRRVTTEYVAFIDDDAVLEPDTLTILQRHFTDLRVAAAAPRVLGLHPRGHAPGSPSGRADGSDAERGSAATDGGSWVSRYEDARSSLDLGLDPGLVRVRAPISWVPSTCLLARVSALGEGFTPGMRVGEDVDLVWRLAAEGHHVRYEPAATVRHEHRTAVPAWLKRKAFYGTGADLLARRHGRDVAPAVLTPWSAAFALALLAQRRWSLPVAAVLFAAATARLAAKVGGTARPGKVGGTEHPVRLGALLTRYGAVATIWQIAGLLLRHWWPLTAVGCLFSVRLRRAVAAAALLDTVVDLRRTRAHLDPVRFAVARRLDDLAYGAGVWYGALKGRSLRALLPDIRITDRRDHAR